MQAGALFSQITDELPGLQVINRESSSLESLLPHLHFDSHSSTWPRSPAFSVTSSGGHTKLSPVWYSLCCCRWGLSGTQEASPRSVETHECVYYGFEENSRFGWGCSEGGAHRSLASLFGLHSHRDLLSHYHSPGDIFLFVFVVF